MSVCLFFCRSPQSGILPSPAAALHLRRSRTKTTACFHRSCGLGVRVLLLRSGLGFGLGPVSVACVRTLGERGFGFLFSLITPLYIAGKRRRSVFLLRRLVDRSITTDLNLFYWGTRYEGGRKKIKHVVINDKLRAEKDRKKKRSRVTFTQTHSYRRLEFFCGQRVNGRSEGENLDMSTKFDDSDRREELKIRQKLFKIECNHLI